MYNKTILAQVIRFSRRCPLFAPSNIYTRCGPSFRLALGPTLELFSRRFGVSNSFDLCGIRRVVEGDRPSFAGPPTKIDFWPAMTQLTRLIAPRFRFVYTPFSDVSIRV